MTVSALFDGAVDTDWIAAPATGRTAPAQRLPGSLRPPRGRGLDRRGAVRRCSAATSRRSRPRTPTRARLASSPLLALSLPLSILGVVNTRSLAVIERTRELGLLRAVGATQGQVRAMIR